MIFKVNKSKLKELEVNLRVCKYDRVIIDSVIEGHFGEAYVDSLEDTKLIRIDSGAFTVLCGDPHSKCLSSILEKAPIYYVTPQNNEWSEKLISIFGDRITKLKFTDYQPSNISKDKLYHYINQLNPEFQLNSINESNVNKVVKDIGNEYFFENFHSISDYINRGVGYCIEYKGKIVSAATSMAQSSTSIDIEIETKPEFQKKGLGTIVAAKLILHCLENGINPRWLAANRESEKLAEKLMFSRHETYFTFEIEN